MELMDKTKAVSRMQHYIINHIDEPITLEALANAAGTVNIMPLESSRNIQAGRTPFETIRAMRLTKAAQTLQSLEEKVVDVVMRNGLT